MAKFIKFNCTAAATQPTVLIAVDQIAAVTTNAAGTATTIQLNTSATANWVITHAVALAVGVTENSVVEAIYKAMGANPGGIISTVGSPILLLQTPVAQTGSGRQPITRQQSYVSYIQNVWTA
jgi:hypothetical protein